MEPHYKNIYVHICIIKSSSLCFHLICVYIWRNSTENWPLGSSLVNYHSSLCFSLYIYVRFLLSVRVFTIRTFLHHFSDTMMMIVNVCKIIACMWKISTFLLLNYYKKKVCWCCIRFVIHSFTILLSTNWRFVIF